MELKEYRWKPENRSVEGKIQIIGKFPLTMRLRVPENYILTGTECIGVKSTAQQENNGILAVTFLADKSGEYPFKINFKL